MQGKNVVGNSIYIIRIVLLGLAEVYVILCFFVSDRRTYRGRYRPLFCASCGSAEGRCICKYFCAFTRHQSCKYCLCFCPGMTSSVVTADPLRNGVGRI